MSSFNRESILARRAEMLNSVASQPVSSVPGTARPSTKAVQSAAQAAVSSRLPACRDDVAEEPSSDEEFESSTPAPPHEKGKRGVQMRNACVTYYTPFLGPLESHAPFTAKQLANYIAKPAHDHIEFYVSVLEVAPKTGLLHGHLYIEFNQPKTILQIQKMIPHGSKVFMRKGTQNQAVDYVFKRGKYEYKHYTQLVPWIQQRYGNVADLDQLVPFVYGTRKVQGARSDLDRYVEMAFDGVQRNEFLATERGAGLRYLRYFSDACSIVDGLDRNDTARANKRVLYEKYCDDCESRGEVPCAYYQFNSEPDFKWNDDSRRHYVDTMSAAMAERDQRDDDERIGASNKQLLDSRLSDKKGDGSDGQFVRKDSGDDDDDVSSQSSSD